MIQQQTWGIKTDGISLKSMELSESQLIDVLGVFRLLFKYILFQNI